MTNLYKILKLKIVSLVWVIKYIFKHNKAIIAMQGRLGNQMFIHAFALRLKKQCGIQPVYDISFYNNNPDSSFVLGKYNINVPTKGFDYNKILPDKFKCTEKEYGWYNDEYFNTPALFYTGYFQSEKFFKEFRDELVEEFRFNVTFDEEYSKWAQKIENCNSVLIHFRATGDYKDLGWALDFDYQRKAMDYIAQRIDNPKFFVFSCDIQYIKDNFKCDYELEYVDIGKNNPDKVYFDMELMKKCKHDIIPNSTFSWWAAWLNENPDKIVVAPTPWLFKESEIVPEDWIKISAEKIFCENPLIV